MLRPLLPCPILPLDPFRFDDANAPHRALMPSKNMCASPGRQVPDADCPVRRPADEGVSRHTERPHAAVVLIERVQKLAGNLAVD